MFSKLKIKFYDLIIVFVSFLLFLIYFSDFRKEYNLRVVVLFPKIPVIFFNSGNFHFEISNGGEKVFTPTFFNTPYFTEIDSRITKKFYFCDQARVYNYQMSSTMMTFTIDSHLQEKLDACFNKLSNLFKKKWEDAKDTNIKFLSESHYLTSDFSKILAKKVLKPFEDVFNNFKDLNCKQYINLFANDEVILEEIYKTYIDVCGKHLKLVFAEEDNTNLDFETKNSFNSTFEKYLNQQKINNYKFINNHFFFPVFLNIKNSNQNENTSVVVNKRLLELFDAYDKIFPNEVGFVWEGEISYRNYIAENNDSQLSVQLAILKSYMNAFLSNINNNSAPHTFEKFRNSELTILRSETYILGSSRQFSTFGIYFTSLVFALLLTILNRFIITLITNKFNEKK